MRTLAFACLFVLVPFSGCTNGSEGLEGGPLTDSSDPTTGAPAIPTDEFDDGVEVVEGEEGSYACARPGTEIKADPNRTYEGGAHQHDEWGGQNQKTFFEGPVNGANFFDTKGGVVITGTDRVDVKVSWTPKVSTTPETRTLKWTMPGDGKLYKEYTHTFAASGENHSIPINLSNNDPPHYKRSTWQFGFDNGPQQVSIILYRGYDCLPIDPPHYDHWAGATVKELSKTVILVKEEQIAVCAAPANACQGLRMPGTGAWGMTGDNTSVPPGTKRLTVEISWKNDLPGSQKISLEYQTSTTDGGYTAYANYWRAANQETATGTNTRTLEIIPQPEDWDSPYDAKSLWRFRWNFDSTSTHPALGKSGAFKGEITFKFTAYKE